MKILKEILRSIEIVNITGKQDINIEGLTLDSRKVKNGYLFAALTGVKSDGHDFINKAIENGAKAILCQNIPNEINNKVAYIQVKDSSYALGYLASAFYDYPSKKIKIIGITGTNGKTTTATLLYSMFNQTGLKSGLLSTVNNYIGEQKLKATHTTPDAITINYLLKQMIDNDCKYCFMEVSSHAMVQNRTSGIHFSGGVFTNITHDHLDYHQTFKDYIDAKKKFFDNLPKTAFALTNFDDKNGTVMLQNTKAEKTSYALKSFSDFKAKILESHFDGMLLNIDNKEVWTQFIGEFNAYNLLAVYAVACKLGINSDEALTLLSALKPVEGRFETVRLNGIFAIVDYAHTPDALENILKTINDIRTDTQNIITVIGTGGDRDKSKRPIMAKIAADYSNKVIFTSDNPRTENPETIIDDMFSGLDNNNISKALKISNRKEAIRTACMLCNKDDIILIAGKGHETYQEVNGIRYPFDDKEIVQEQLLQINN